MNTMMLLKRISWSTAKNNNIKLNDIPQFPKKAGGETDIMIGIQYQKYFPVEVIRLPSGLTLYESKFVGEDGTRGIIAGPHASFTAVEARYGNQYASKAYLTATIHEVTLGNSLNPDINVLGFKENGDFNKDGFIGDQSYHERLK